jgi:hypothetical protein
MSTFLWTTALVLSLAAMLGSGVIRGAGRVAAIAWWGGIFVMNAIWHQVVG